MPPTPLYGVGSPTGVILSKEIANLHPMALTLLIERWSDLTPTLASGESGQRLMGDLNSQNRISGFVKVVEATVVKPELCRKPFATLTFEVDNRIKASEPPTNPGAIGRPVFW